ncbi:MAG: hypothetical protein QMD23_00010 [Candidatus Bathyarchaeia archaeon]|nr:hypothetical protein [Candidatus Bathyarchaeia archaeon]
MEALLVVMQCPEHGLERFKVKVVRKFNVNPETIMPQFRTKPKKGLCSIVIGRNVEHTEVRDFLLNYFKEAGLMEKVLSIRFHR